jgi:AcrR family transcriptional regulator
MPLDPSSPDSHPPRSGDRRTLRTRRQLRDALMTLILEKGYDAVTVEDITSRADLGRTTFYLHYRDKEELLLESIDAIANDLKAQIDLLQTARQAGSSQPRPIHLAFAHAAENAALYRIILKGEGATKTASRLRRFISDSAAEFLLAWIDNPPKTELSQSNGSVVSPDGTRMKLVADYFASALLGFLTWWLEADMPYPPDQTADFFIQAFFQGARAVLGLPEVRVDRPAAAAASG